MALPHCRINQLHMARFAQIALAISITCSGMSGCGSEPSQRPEATASTLLSRIVVNPPAFNHPAVSEASIQAVKNAISALPAAQREKLDRSAARVIISPNMIDRWPDSVKDLPEANPQPTLAEQPGRIYGVDMCVYERPKKRGTTDLGAAREPAYIQLQVGDMLFQVLDGDTMTLSKDPALRKEYEADKVEIPAEAQAKMAEFTKLDDWGPRETCAEMFGSMMGGHNENTDNLYKYFPRVKKWLIAKLGIENQAP
ncbi:MAG: hypothetical protein QG574_4305 [Cyanobacteriota bacterium erpe_2018_sw_21hr_WHONDRS-SW48-000092_B_bin.40]|nr:hypothetical protein [Cyanobacteriota bacterium erpe_2018_sw_21hr_WHONDRS-SW48-000092_B_bin.40]